MSACTHHWLIASVEDANGGALPSRCRDCGAERTHPRPWAEYETGAEMFHRMTRGHFQAGSSEPAVHGVREESRRRHAMPAPLGRKMPRPLYGDVWGEDAA